MEVSVYVRLLSIYGVDFTYFPSLSRVRLEPPALGIDGTQTSPTHTNTTLTGYLSKTFILHGRCAKIILRSNAY